MKFSITLDEQELQELFGNNWSWLHPVPEGKSFLTIGRKVFDIEWSSIIGVTKGLHHTVNGSLIDKKAQEIAKAKAEVNRTKEAHKEAQRKLNALMEEEDGNS